MKQKSLRILITPNVANPYDQRMVKEMADGFNRIGHFGAGSPVPLSAIELKKLCESTRIDVVIQINRTRDPDIPLPPYVRYVSWFQDVYPETLDRFAESFHDSDILYSLGDPEVLGINVKVPCCTGSLFTGVAPTTLDFNRQNIRKDIDFSLCGGLPHPVVLNPSLRTDLLWYMDSVINQIPLMGRSRALWLIRKALFRKHLPVDHVPYSTLLAIARVVETFYRPLRGELDIHELADLMSQQAALPNNSFREIPRNSLARPTGRLSELLKPHTSRFYGRGDLRARLIRYVAGESSFFQHGTVSPIRKAISFFSQSYPRIMDRNALVEAAARVSKSLELYGPGLDSHEFARPYLKGVINNQDELLKVYCRSKINLSNNTHGLGLHSRTLECMAVGGFIFMHESPHDNEVGGMLTSFEPGVHYGSYTPENFAEEAARWLKDDSGRMRAGMQAESMIRDRHCWHHRAQQIIDDLNR